MKKDECVSHRSACVGMGVWRVRHQCVSAMATCQTHTKTLLLIVLEAAFSEVATSVNFGVDKRE